MHARPVSPSPLTLLRLSEPLLNLLRWTVAATAALLLLLSCLLLVRRLTGGLQQPLDTASLLAVGGALAMLAAVLRVLWSRITGRPVLPDAITRWSDFFLFLLLPSTALLLLGVSLSLPGSPPWGLVLFWGVLILEEIGWWIVGLRSAPVARLLSWRRTLRADRAAEGLPEARGRLEDTPLFGAFHTLQAPTPGVWQQLIRAREESGAEVVFGLLRGDFAPGERSQSLHVAFCPPFEGAPELSVEQVDGPPTLVKPAQVQSYGARLDLRLSSPSRQPASVVVRLYARRTPAAPTTEISEMVD